MKTCYLLLKALAATVGVLIALALLICGVTLWVIWCLDSFGDVAGFFACLLPVAIGIIGGTIWLFYSYFIQKAGK